VKGIKVRILHQHQQQQQQQQQILSTACSVHINTDIHHGLVVTSHDNSRACLPQPPPLKLNFTESSHDDLRTAARIYRCLLHGGT